MILDYFTSVREKDVTVIEKIKKQCNKNKKIKKVEPINEDDEEK